MPRPTPFHPRTAAASTSFLWKEWAGFAAVRAFDGHSEREYFAVRHGVGAIDVSPLYKYDLRGPDAAAVLAFLFSRDVGKLREGRVTYGCLLDERGKVLDDGTITRLGPAWYRLTSSEPWLGWLLEHASRRDCAIDDVSGEVAALAVQGPRARATLERVFPETSSLPFFRAVAVPGAIVTRTGYTGDLGYEVWVTADRACDLWDRVISSGRAYDLCPFGLDALDVLRIEAGFVLQGVDYLSARSTLLERRMSTPDEIGLGATVDLDRDAFLGQAALRAERGRDRSWSLVGIDVSWPALEALYARFDLPPHLAPVASREPVPVFASDGRTQVGYATSRTWSPLLKRSIGLATVRGGYGKAGTRLKIEHTVEFERHTVDCVVAPTPFYDPQWKRGGAPQ